MTTGLMCHLFPARRAPGAAAVEWAADDASRTGAELLIVHMLDRQPYAVTRFLDFGQSNYLLMAAAKVLEAAVRARQPSVRVRAEIVESMPAGTSGSILGPIRSGRHGQQGDQALANR
ncbi:universal stress protein [Nonomuraea spiralis]|uniref:universal stress protein n=1 Tax=Nonomuraea spiralis TaxID=46182 RepID=UPI00378BC0C1